MLFKCEHCSHEVESGEPAVLPQGIALICSNCGGLNWLSKKPLPAPKTTPTVQPEAMPSPAPTTEPPEVPPVVPASSERPVEQKAILPQTKNEGNTLPPPKVTGGFVFMEEKPKKEAAKKTTFALPKTAPAEPASMKSPALQPAIKRGRAHWAKLIEQNYEEQSAHKRFMEFCSSEDILDFAAYCYRKKIYEEGEDPMSKWAMEHIIGLATVKYLAPIGIEERSTISPTARKVMWTIVAFGLAILLYLVSSMIANMEQPFFLF